VNRPHGPDLAVTLDVDWAPDWAIDLCAETLARSGVKATWFVTHASAAVDRLRERPQLFELGIHPNFLAGSTHGETHDEVLAHCMELVPEAKSMRAHGLAQSSRLLQRVVHTTPIEIDLSIFLPYMPGIRPVLYTEGGSELVRLPYWWEDDYEMELDPPRFGAAHIAEGAPGIRIVNFHPIHVALNSASMLNYRALISASSPLQGSSEKDALTYRFDGAGTRTVFEEVCRMLGEAGSWRIGDARERLGDVWPTRREPAP
jgi:hypothetical protein